MNGHLLNSNNFAFIDFDAYEERAIAKVMTFLEHFMGNEARKTETKGIWLLRRSLKVFPRWVWHEWLDDMTGLKPDTSIHWKYIWDFTLYTCVTKCRTERCSNVPYPGLGVDLWEWMIQSMKKANAIKNRIRLQVKKRKTN